MGRLVVLVKDLGTLQVMVLASSGTRVSSSKGLPGTKLLLL
jgi:hypothetical protein